MNLYLDTCVLPERGRLRSGTLQLLLALQAASRITVHIPTLAVDEYRNLRFDRAREAELRFRGTYKRAYEQGLLEESGVYVRSAEEVADEIVGDLRRLVTPIPLEGEDARAALGREASRLRPARDGKGARDSAIWLAIVRHHKASGVPGTFMTVNTKDFAASEDKSQPHPQLLDDLGDSAERFGFSFVPHAFIETLAPETDTASFDRYRAAQSPDLRSELARSAAESGAFTNEECGADSETGTSIWETDSGAFSILSLTPLRVRRSEDSFLALATVSAEAMLVDSNGRVPVTLQAWLESSGEHESLVDVEFVRREPVAADADQSSA